MLGPARSEQQWIAFSEFSLHIPFREEVSCFSGVSVSLMSDPIAGVKVFGEAEAPTPRMPGRTREGLIIPVVVKPMNISSQILPLS
jgi:hypothetical protein